MGDESGDRRRLGFVACGEAVSFLFDVLLYAIEFAALAYLGTHLVAFIVHYLSERK